MTDANAGTPLPWWRTFFDRLYAEFALMGRDRGRLEREVAFLEEILELSPGRRVLDQCCGVGRLSLPLAERGVEVLGVEQVPEYVEQAAARAREAGAAAEFRCADAFTFVADPPCDAGFNWFTSFGYCEDDADNRRMLERAFQSIRPGGRFALDYKNMAHVLAEFQPRHYWPADAADPDGVVVLEEAAIDFARGMVDSQWTFLLPDGRRDHRRVSTRLYLPHELIGLLRGCGFADCRLFGSAGGEPLERHSPRCIVVAERP